MLLLLLRFGSQTPTPSPPRCTKAPFGRQRRRRLFLGDGGPTLPLELGWGPWGDEEWLLKCKAQAGLGARGLAGCRGCRCCWAIAWAFAPGRLKIAAQDAALVRTTRARTPLAACRLVGHGLHVYGGRNTSSATSTRTAVEPDTKPPSGPSIVAEAPRPLRRRKPRTGRPRPQVLRFAHKGKPRAPCARWSRCAAHTAWRVVLQMPESALSRPRGRRLPEATLSALRTANGVASIHCEHCGHLHGEGRNLSLLVPAQKQSPQQQPKKN